MDKGFCEACGAPDSAQFGLYNGGGQLVHICEACVKCSGQGCGRDREDPGRRLCRRCFLDARIAYSWRRVGYDCDYCQEVAVCEAVPRTQHRLRFGTVVRGERMRLNGAEVLDRRLPQNRGLSWDDVGVALHAPLPMLKNALHEAGLALNGLNPPKDVHVFDACHYSLAVVQDGSKRFWCVMAGGDGHAMAYNRAGNGPPGACLCVCERKPVLLTL